MAKSLRIYQLHDGYCYNTDSLIFGHFACKFLNLKSKRLLDIGCGSGILGILCARELAQRNLNFKLDLVEKDLIMSFLASKNASDYPHIVHNVDFLDFKSEIKYDFILSNPPFYTKNALQGENERKNMARNQLFLPLDSMLLQIKRVIKPNGILCMCYDSRLSVELICSVVNAGFNIEIMQLVHPLKSKESSLVMIKARIDSKSPLSILPPIFTHNSPTQSDNTKELKNIYQWAKTNSIKVYANDVILDS